MLDVRIILLIILFVITAILVISYFKFRDRRKEIVLLVVTLLFSVSLLEIFVRRFFPLVQEHNRMFEYDETLGWRFIPNNRGAIIYPDEVRHYIKTNAFGFRDDPPPLQKDDVKKILILGDSFVSNISVRDHDVFTEVMEKELKNVSVINMGVNGYGQVQEYLLLERLFEQMDPDLVILVIYIRNDFTENSGGFWLYPQQYSRPYAGLEEGTGTLKIFPPPELPKEDGKESIWHFYRRFQLYQFFQQRLHRLIHKVQEGDPHSPSVYTPPELYLCRRDLPENIESMHRLMEQLLLKIDGFVRERNVPLLFVIAPSILQVEDDLWATTLREFEVSKEGYDQTLPNQRILTFAEKNNLMVFDLLPALRRAKKNGEDLYNRSEQHWTIQGNHTVAHALNAFLTSGSLGMNFSGRDVQN